MSIRGPWAMLSLVTVMFLFHVSRVQHCYYGVQGGVTANCTCASSCVQAKKWNIVYLAMHTNVVTSREVFQDKFVRGFPMWSSWPDTVTIFSTNVHVHATLSGWVGGPLGSGLTHRPGHGRFMVRRTEQGIPGQTAHLTLNTGIVSVLSTRKIHTPTSLQGCEAQSYFSLSWGTDTGSIINRRVSSLYHIPCISALSTWKVPTSLQHGEV